MTKTLVLSNLITAAIVMQLTMYGANKHWKQVLIRRGYLVELAPNDWHFIKVEPKE